MKKENNLTNDEMSEISKLNGEYQSVVFSIGELGLKKTQLQKELNRINEDESELLDVFDTMKTKESDFITRLESKYGPGSLDATSGKYISV
jgi:hypothetical protein